MSFYNDRIRNCWRDDLFVGRDVNWGPFDVSVRPAHVVGPLGSSSWHRNLENYIYNYFVYLLPLVALMLLVPQKFRQTEDMITYPKSISLLDGVGRELLALGPVAVGVQGAHQAQGSPGNRQGSVLGKGRSY